MDVTQNMDATESRWKRAGRSRLTAAAAGGVAALLVAGSLAVAAEPNGDEGVIHACAKSSTGALRIVDSESECRSGERHVTWNQTGPAGAQGPAGELALAGQQCTAGQFVSGFDADGDIVCAAPAPDDGGGSNPVDADGDGFTTGPGGDCNDADATVNPSAEEIRDSRDNNCDGYIDEGLVDCNDNDPFTDDFYDPVSGTCKYQGTDGDTDDDGFMSVGAGGLDCDDLNPWTNPGVEEVDDGIDNDCDGTADEPGPGVANETNADAEADFCSVHFPSTTTVSVGELSEAVYGRIYEPGVTDVPPSPDTEFPIIAELGWGPDESDPTSDEGWSFSAAEFDSRPLGSNDYEYKGFIQAPPRSGTFSYAYRFSLDGGASYTYCDLDGAGSTAMGAIFQPQFLGEMTVQ